VKEIKAELQSLGVSFQDCFDKESLFQRLIEARRPRGKQEDADPGPSSGATQSANSVGGDDRAVASSTGDTGGASTSKDDTPSQDAPPSASPKVTTKVRDSASTTDSFHVEEEEEVTIRAMSVKELRSELASHNVRWQSFVDKNDLIRAVQQVRQEAAKFSVTGRLVPGRVGDLTDKEVKRELERVTPMLLDVYATWCGPCQLMGPILEQASEQLHVRVRFAKMDSDKYPELSGRLGVQGLPTLILFKDGAEVGRVEGALRKDQLVEWIQAKLLS
jgi:thioredoxin